MKRPMKRIHRCRYCGLFAECGAREPLRREPDNRAGNLGPHYACRDVSACGKRIREQRPDENTLDLDDELPF